MAGQSPNSININKVAGGVANSTGVAVHPEYLYHRPDWQKLRDVLAGQREIKRASTRYLKAQKGQDQEDYELYLDRATFYNMTAQTLNGMVGQVFSRDPIILNMPKKFRDSVRHGFAKDGAGHIAFIKTIITEQIAMGRFGVLVDAPSVPTTTTAASYAVGYAAENILDWAVEDVNGTYQLTRVLLREFVRDSSLVNRQTRQQNPWIAGSPQPLPPQSRKPDIRTPQGPGARTVQQRVVRPAAAYIEAYTYSTVYRELCLEQQSDGSYRYVQYVYADNPNGAPYDSFTPMVRGLPLDFIPFAFFGATGNTADVEKSPILDIADLNISHYRTYAELEWGRMWTALPVYYAPGREDEGAAEYHIGPSMVWEVPSGEAVPGIIEYKGQGLQTLEKALVTKEMQIAAIGGRMMPGVTSKGSASAQESERSAQSEQALLLNVLQAAEFGYIAVMRWWLMWRDVPFNQTEDLDYQLNRDFGAAPITAREIRAIQMLHDEGKVPIDVLLNVLLKAEYLPPETTVEEFKAMLEDPTNFPNNPDVGARMRGFASRQQELDQAMVAREADMQEEEIALQEREVELMENAPPPLPPKAPTPANAALPTPAKGPLTPKPGRGGKTAAIKKPKAGGQGG